MKPLLFCLLVVAPLAACGGEAPPPPKGGMPVTVEAPKNAVYELRCRYRAIRIKGQGPANSINLSGKGPREGTIPTDNARCTLKQTAGSGPVSVTITKAGATAATASVAGPGSTATLDVL